MSEKIICLNKKAKLNYFLEEFFEAGISLLGSEVKSLRSGRANLGDSYAIVRNEECYLLNAHISPYDPASHFGHDPERTRKLLLHKHEIKKLMGRVETKGYSLIPTKLYFKNGKVKVELALAHGKKKYDKREDIKKREQMREVKRALKQKR